MLLITSEVQKLLSRFCILMYSFNTSICLQDLFEHFMSHNGCFSVVSLYSSEENCILMESPFHAELNGPHPNAIY